MINLNYRDPRPLYEQIKDELRMLVITGVFGPDDKLPSVRELAVEMAINPNTIQRAYRELEASGYIYTVAGKGTFAAHDSDVSASRKAELFEQLKATAEELRMLKVTDQEMIEFIKKGSEEFDKG